MKFKKVHMQLNKVLDDYTMIGYHMEAIHSILTYPELYKLGQLSAYPMCIYKHTTSDLAEMEYYQATGCCPACEAARDYGIDAVNIVDLDGGDY
jgi:hypothetical protein